MSGIGYAGVSLPLATVDGVNTDSPVLYYVHTDHLSRPIMMTDALKANVWSAVWNPWGSVHSTTGALADDRRFPGQWYQLEAGLHYNWHRHYDPTIGRYSQADPLGFVDGQSGYGYAKGQPIEYVDPDGRLIFAIIVGAAIGLGLEFLANHLE